MKLVIRADADTVIGTGHVMRGLALAQAWQEKGGEVLFLTAGGHKALVERLVKEGCQVRQLQPRDGFDKTLAVIGQEQPDWVVLDGYHFTSVHQREIKKLGAKLLVMDDYAHLPCYCADLVVNQNFGAEKLPYQGEAGSRFLLGPTYALLRREFREYGQKPREMPSVATKLLITLGGADPNNLTQKVIKALNRSDIPLQVKVVVGPQNPHRASLLTAGASLRQRLEFFEAVPDMAKVMAWADIAVTAGGSTLWELCFLGVPALVGIIADNQEFPVSNLTQGGYVLSVGHLNKVQPNQIGDALNMLLENRNLREELHTRCKNLVDGSGGYRVVHEMQINHKIDFNESLKKDYFFGNITFKNFVNLSEDDKYMVLQWRNSPEIRQWMLTNHIISQAEHNSFINRLLYDNFNSYWIVFENNKPIGVGNFQHIDIYNGKTHLGIYTVSKGKGKIIMQNLLNLGFNFLNLTYFICDILAENITAINFYKKFGFTLEEGVNYVKRGGVVTKVVRMSLKYSC